MKKRLNVWDSDSPPPPDQSLYFLWQSACREESGRVVSAAALIEGNAVELRNRFVKWAEDISEIEVNGKSVRQRLAFDGQLSLWWSSPIAVKCGFEASTWITDALKLLCLRDWIASTRGVQVAELAYHGTRKDIAECVAAICAKQNIEFHWVPPENGVPHTRKMLALLVSKIPRTLQGGLWIARFVARRIGLHQEGAREWMNTRGAVCFVDYFLHIGHRDSSRGHFKSAYWSSLPDELSARGVKSNWLHVLLPHIDGYSARDTRTILRALNSAPDGHETHCCVDSFLTLSMAFVVLADYIKLSIRNLGLRQLPHPPTLDGVDVWPLARKHWLDGLFGTPLASSLMYTHLFRRALGHIKHQNVGVYLQEGAAWEYPMLAAWRRSSHGTIIGNPHSTVRFWDMRYTGAAPSDTGSALDRPQPDLIAVNGPSARSTLVGAGYSNTRLVEVEALRYSHLTQMPNHLVRRDGERRRLLVVTEYSPRVTAAQLDCLKKALPLTSGDWDIWAKSHIACDIPRQTFLNLRMTEVAGSVFELACNADAVFVGPMTSAALDVLGSRAPLAVFRDPNEVDWSPVRGLPGVKRVCSPTDLASFLLSPIAESERACVGEFFHLDTQVTCWRQLILGALPSDPAPDITQT